MLLRVYFTCNQAARAPKFKYHFMTKSVWKKKKDYKIKWKQWLVTFISAYIHSLFVSKTRIYLGFTSLVRVFTQTTREYNPVRSTF